MSKLVCSGTTGLKGWSVRFKILDLRLKIEASTNRQLVTVTNLQSKI
jgi:hypothetical protein